MLAYMKRTTVKLPDHLDTSLRHEASRRGVTVSQLTREAIEQYFELAARDRQLIAVGAGRSGRSDVSERIEEILTAEITSPR